MTSREKRAARAAGRHLSSSARRPEGQGETVPTMGGKRSPHGHQAYGPDARGTRIVEVNGRTAIGALVAALGRLRAEVPSLFFRGVGTAISQSENRLELVDRRVGYAIAVTAYEPTSPGEAAGFIIEYGPQEQTATFDAVHAARIAVAWVASPGRARAAWLRGRSVAA